MYQDKISPQKAFAVLRLAANSRQDSFTNIDEVSQLLKVAQIPQFILRKESKESILDTHREEPQIKEVNLTRARFDEPIGMSLSSLMSHSSSRKRLFY